MWDITCFNFYYFSHDYRKVLSFPFLFYRRLTTHWSCPWRTTAAWTNRSSWPITWSLFWVMLWLQSLSGTLCPPTFPPLRYVAPYLSTLRCKIVHKHSQYVEYHCKYPLKKKTLIGRPHLKIPYLKFMNHCQIFFTFLFTLTQLLDLSGKGSWWD